ncbi:DUF1990 family protein [Zafaria sp. Z1313]|uniref:DUF1990 family protein n=1 Tax=Zafaria sp. Z1313 TaxID=3423202 RepID=UPI003D303A16
MDPLSPLRTRLRLTFSGQADGVPAWEEALADGDDAGFFAPDSATWAVHGGMTPIAAGIRALLVQALHPGALAGVAEHSDYRTDPLARLAGTIRWIFTLTYGDTGAARAACAYVRRRHGPVTGSYVDGTGTERPYAANDPGLAEWVHLAFTDAFLRSYEHFRGPVPADRGGADAYVREWAVAGELMGVEDPPRSEEQLRARLAEYDAAGRLAGGPRVREVVAFLKEPPLDPLLLPGYRLLFAAVVDTLDERQLELLGLERPSVRLPRGRRVGLPARWGGRLALAVTGVVLQKQGPSELAALRRLARLGRPADLNYPDHGHTRTGEAPPGYHVVRRHVRVGHGEEAFRRLAEGILGWGLQRGAGLVVDAERERAAPGVRVVSGFGAGPFRLPAPCRVLWVEEPPAGAGGPASGRTTPEPGPVAGAGGSVGAGFGYGTLRGHPEAGEESFRAVLDPDGSVYVEVFAYSRPATVATRLGAPAAAAVQRLVTDRYVAAAFRLAAGG